MLSRQRFTKWEPTTKIIHTKSIAKDIQETYPTFTLSLPTSKSRATSQHMKSSKPKRTERDTCPSLNFKNRSQSLKKSESDWKLVERNGKKMQEKLEEIEKINFAQNFNTLSRNNYDKKRLDENMRKEIKKKKINWNLFLKAREKADEEKRFCLFFNPSSQKPFNGRYCHFGMEKPSKIIDFFTGLSNCQDKEPATEFSELTNLNALKGKIRKSEGLTDICNDLSKQKRIERLSSEDLKENFESAIYAMNFVEENGQNNHNSKKVMNLSRCIP